MRTMVSLCDSTQKYFISQGILYLRYCYNDNDVADDNITITTATTTIT